METERFRISTGGGVAFDAYLITPNGEAGRPLFFFLPGSGPRSVQGFLRRQLLPIASRHGVAIASLDKLGATASDEEESRNRLFELHDHREQRTADAVRVYRTIIAPYRPIQLFLLGYSEGADIAVRLAARHLERVDGVGLFAAGLLDVATELTLAIHHRVRTGLAPLDRVTRMLVDHWVESRLKRVRSDPSPDRTLFGLTHRRWASYLDPPPLEDLLRIRTTVLAVHGGRDRRVVMDSPRRVRTITRAEGECDFRLLEFPELDHDFRTRAGTSKLGGVLDLVVRGLLRD